MANVPAELRYTTDHEYARSTSEAGVVFVGITDYAQGELGDVVFVNLPKPGDTLAAHQVFGTIEAVKAVSDLYMPVSGEVVEANGALDANPAAINSDPYGEGWMIKVRADDASAVAGLLDAAGYERLIG
jgi:glycine cleavage system H protein